MKPFSRSQEYYFATLLSWQARQEQKIAAIVFAMVAIFETVGPFLAVHAFRISGEVGKDDHKEDDLDNTEI